MTGGRLFCWRRRYLQNWDKKMDGVIISVLSHTYRVQELKLDNGYTCTADGVRYDVPAKEINSIPYFFLIDMNKPGDERITIFGSFFRDMPEGQKISFENIPDGFDTTGVMKDILAKLKEVLPGE